MCRWLAYSGSPVRLEELLLRPEHSLIDQSLASRMSPTTTNGDGFGLGWYGDTPAPALFRSIEPAWNNRNLKDLARHLKSGLVFAHVRASTGTAVQQTNCHPFRHDRWLWMHNGLISGYRSVKRDLAFAVDPSLFAEIEGSTDSELFFYLALSMGLEDDPMEAVERAVGFIEKTGRAHGIDDPVTLTVATTEGERIWAFRYSSHRQSRSLFYSTEVETLREQFPNNPVFGRLSDDARMIVSEPQGELAGVWREFPESSCCVIEAGDEEMRSFRPRA
jgi:predicted glutamine amidotransferase